MLIGALHLEVLPLVRGFGYKLFETLLLQPRKHNIHRFGIYSSKTRAYRAKANLALSTCTNEGRMVQKLGRPRPCSSKWLRLPCMP